MKIKSLILIFLIPLLFVSCSANTELHEMISLENDEYMDIILYNTSTEILEECKEKTKFYSKFFDREHSYEGMENIYSLNKKRDVTLSGELVEALHFAESILKNYASASLLAGGLNDLWDTAYVEKTIPTSENIDKELDIISSSKLEYEDNRVSIIGEASLDLDFMKRGFILSKLKSYLLSEGVTEYIINYSSRSIIYGKNPGKKYFKSSFYGIKNGYYKMEDMAVSCLGADLIVWYSPEGYRFTNVPSCSTGIPYDGYEKLFVFSKDSLLSDILAYAFFNMKLEEIQKEEVLKEVYTMMYKDLSLVYRNSYLTELMID